MLTNRLFRTKPPQALIDEAYHPDRLMKRTLSAFDLIAFGVGATIGSGIFALTGTACAGQAPINQHWLSTPIINFALNSPIGRAAAGPALVISFLIAAFACGLAALCYAELAAMIPVSGSAYTFAHAALGEVIAWIIGWDLILEYAVGNVAMAVSWLDHFLHFVHGISGWKLPLALTCDTSTALDRIATMTHKQQELYSNMSLPQIFGHPFALNIPALVIVALITWILVVGIKESAKANLLIVLVKCLIVCFLLFTALPSLILLTGCLLPRADYPVSWVVRQLFSSPSSALTQ